jgi:hypothetical protein
VTRPQPIEPGPAREADRLRALSDLVPILEAPDPDIGRWVWPAPRDGVQTLGWFEPGAAVEAWRAALVRGHWIVPGFAWPAWLGTDRGLALRDDPAALETATAMELAWLLTAIIRSDRFTEGSIEGAFRSGLVLRIARRAAQLLAAVDQ